jgi:predicted nucleic acid-binding Zn ribbon protein
LSRSRHLKSTGGQPQQVGDLLAKYLNRSGLAPKVEAASVLGEWADRVGPQIAAVTQPLRVNEGTLFVAVSTSAWMMELNLMKGELMRHLNAGKGKGKLQQLVFVMGEGPGHPSAA